MRKFFTWLSDQFALCPETRWCLKCNRRVQCQYGRNHAGRKHGHVPDPYSRTSHRLEWFVASR